MMLKMDDPDLVGVLEVGECDLDELDGPTGAACSAKPLSIYTMSVP